MSKKPLKDHREIGRELDLFSFHEYAPGAVFWHPKGWIIYKKLQEYIRSKIEPEGYQEISTPVMIKNQLYKQSGHWEHFGEHNMFNLAVYEDQEVAQDRAPAEVNYSLKPMNCPEAAIVYSTNIKSYHDLPLRLSEFGILHRRELSGVLGGAFRVRQFMIDDAHLFVRPDQIQQEIHKLLLLVSEVYESFGFKSKYYLSTKPDKAMGDLKTWHQAEKDLEQALKESKVSFDIKAKDGAFYGPKIDTHINDSQNRDWQLATIQLDFQIPERMQLTYIDTGGSKKRPIMIHRAILGSFERFIGILTEHFQGAFPIWLSPIQASVLPVSDKSLSYAKKLQEKLVAANLLVHLDQRNETLQAKIRDATLQKIPYLLIVGEREEKAGEVAVRTREGKDLGQTTLEDFTTKIRKDIATRSRT